MQHVVLTGGCGFLGINLYQYLRTHDYEVSVVDIGDRFKRYEHFYAGSIPIHRIDLSERVLKFTRKIDFIIHLAAWPHVDFSYYLPHICLENNIMSLIHIAQFSQRNDIPLILASSVEVYGGKENCQYDESSPLSPVSSYGVSKKVCEEILQIYMAQFSLRAITVRFTNLYGRYQLPDRIIPRVITRALLGHTTDIESSFERDFLYIDDAVKAVEKIIRNPKYGSIYNISSGQHQSIHEITDILSKISGFPCAIDKESKQAKMPRGEHLKISNRKLISDTGWHPQVRISEGLYKTFLWYKQNRSWWHPLRETLLKDRKTPNYIYDYVTNK